MFVEQVQKINRFIYEEKGKSLILWPVDMTVNSDASRPILELVFLPETKKANGDILFSTDK